MNKQKIKINNNSNNKMHIKKKLLDCIHPKNLKRHECIHPYSEYHHPQIKSIKNHNYNHKIKKKSQGYYLQELNYLNYSIINQKLIRKSHHFLDKIIEYY